MSGGRSDQGSSKSKFPDDLTTAIVTGQLVGDTASKPKTSWLKSKAKKVAKVFPSSKFSKSATTSSSTLAASSDDIGASQDKAGSKFPLQGGPSQPSAGEPIVEESVKKLISRPIVELWDEAYDELSKKDKSLVADYEALLYESLVGGVALAGQASAIAFSRLGKMQRCKQMKVLLDQKIKEIDEGKWKLKFKDHELVVKDLVEPVVGVIDWAKDFVGTALEPSPYGSIAWAGVCVLLPLVLNPSKQEAARVKGLDDIATIISQCIMREALYHRRYESTDHGESKREFEISHIRYRDALRALYVKILNFQATSVCFLSKDIFSRVTADMVKWTDWDNMLAEIKKQESALKSIEEQWRDMKYDEECKLHNDRHEQRMKGLSAIEDEVSRVRSVIMQAQNNDRREELLKWLSSVDPSKNYNSARESYALSTGDWLVEESRDFKNWEKAPNSLLWLHGKAGAGKSFLSSSVIHHLKKSYGSDPCTALAYFYFSFSETEKQSTENMLRSLIVQLCGGRPDTPKPLLDLHLYRDKNLQPGLENLEEILQASTQDFRSVYLVIDALDECPQPNGERDKLLKCLEKIHNWTLTNLHVLYTSRPELDIKAELAPLFSGPTTSIIDLQKRREEVNRDIGTYIDQKIASSDFRYWPPEAKNDVKAALTDKADGMFQYVALQLKALQKTKSSDAVYQALKDLPAGLDETYERALSSIDPCQQAQAIRSLKWLAFSMRPLSLSELAEASIIDPKSSPPFDKARRYFSPMNVLDFLPSQVTVVYSEDSDSSTSWNEENDSIKTGEEGQKRYTVGLAHFSVKEYLVSDRMRAGRYSIKEITANISIAETCLLYLLQFDKPDSLNPRTLEEFPLVGYAAEYWTQHARWAREDAIAFHLLIMEFFLLKRDTCVNWVRLFNPDEPGYQPNITKGLKSVASPLYYASLTGLIESVRRLLEKGADVNAQGGFYGNALQAASIGGHDQIVERLLEKGADVNAQAQGGFYGNALQAASVGGHDQIVKRLLEKGADVNAQAQGGFYSNALQAASARGHDQIVERLLEKGADVNAQGGYYGNALQAASARGHDQIVKRLLEKGADVNAQGGLYGNALQAASVGGHDQIVERLLEKGADVNAQGGFYGNALQAASARGHDQIVKRLLEKGADVNAQGGYYGNALQAASARGHDQIVERLLEKGADVNAQGGLYGNALQAASAGGHDQIVERLLEKGADVNAQGGYYGNALQAASARGHDQIVERLLEKGADVNAQGGLYGNALQAASAGGHDQIVERLLEKGADVNAQGGRYGNALQAASAGGHDQIVERLLEKGADVNAQGGLYGNALQAASARDHDQIVKRLLEKGANMNM